MSAEDFRNKLGEIETALSKLTRDGLIIYSGFLGAKNGFQKYRAEHPEYEDIFRNLEKSGLGDPQISHMVDIAKDRKKQEEKKEGK